MNKTLNMKKQLLTLLIFLIPFIAISQTTKKVLIIGIDGCRADAMQLANTPNIDHLIDNGIFSPDALNDDVTISGPGWSAMLCGVWSDKHLVTGNNFSGNDYENYPSLFKYIDDFDSDLHTVSICHWAPINDNIVQDHADFKLNVSSDQEVSDQAVAYLAANDPDLVFLHFDDVDHAGHSHGFSPEVSEYISAIETVDSQLGPILQAIEQRPDYANEDWLILLSSDHGGFGTSHGGTTIDHQNVPFVASGNNIPQALILKDSSVVLDSPVNCLGDSIELQFNGSGDYVQIPADDIFDFGSDRDFTVEFRVRTPISADVAMVGNKDWDTGLNKGFIFSFKYASGPEWKVNIGDGNNRVDINTGGAIADNEWHTIGASFDRDGWIKIYQDGVLMDSADMADIGDITTGEGLVFGTDINGAYDFSGSIAEVRVWDEVLEDQTIADWYCAGLEANHPNYDNLLGYWKMNEGNESLSVFDYSSYENDGVLNGPMWYFPDSIIVYDYSETPRITDVPVTALTHLCVPVQESWNLDGKSHVETCLSTGSLDPDSQNNWELFPNPVNDELIVKMKDLNLQIPFQLEVFQNAGNKIYMKNVYSHQISLDLSQFPDGIYFISIGSKQTRFFKKLIKQTQP